MPLHSTYCRYALSKPLSFSKLAVFGNQLGGSSVESHDREKYRTHVSPQSISQLVRMEHPYHPSLEFVQCPVGISAFTASKWIPPFQNLKCNENLAVNGLVAASILIHGQREKKTADELCPFYPHHSRFSKLHF